MTGFVDGLDVDLEDSQDGSKAFIFFLLTQYESMFSPPVRYNIMNGLWTYFSNHTYFSSGSIITLVSLQIVYCSQSP